jgi:hypothetical protein
MPPKKLSPEDCGFGAPKITSAETERDLPTPSADASPTEFFLHVLPNGTEQRFLHEPAVPSLYVTVRDSIETTFTRNCEIWDDESIKKIAMVKPRGLGWIISDYDDDFTTWRRPAVQP